METTKPTRKTPFLKRENKQLNNQLMSLRKKLDKEEKGILYKELTELQIPKSTADLYLCGNGGLTSKGQTILNTGNSIIARRNAKS